MNDTYSNPKARRVLLLATTLVAGLVVAVVWSAWATAQGTATTAWTTPAATITLAPGDATTTEVTFVSTRNYRRVVVSVPPELEPYVTVAPAEIAKVRKREPQTVTLSVSVPTDALAKTITGELTLYRVLGKKLRPLPRAASLPISITVEESVPPAVPEITWTPSSITTSLPAGESKPTAVSFATSTDLENVVVQVSPELKPFVSVEPSAFDSIPKETTTNIDVTFASSTLDENATHSGTIQLQQAINSITDSLPVELTITPANPITMVDASDVGPHLVGAELTDNLGNTITTYLHEALPFKDLTISPGDTSLSIPPDFEYVTDKFVAIDYPDGYENYRTYVNVEHGYADTTDIRVFSFNSDSGVITLLPYHIPRSGVLSLPIDTGNGEFVFAVTKEL